MEGGSLNNGAGLVQAPPLSDGSSDWCFSLEGNDIYEVRNRKSGKSVDVAAFSTNVGSEIHQWTFWGGANQKFSVTLADHQGIPVPAPVPAPTTAPVPAPVPTPVSTPVPVPPPPAQTFSDWVGPVDTPVIAVAASNLPGERSLTSTKDV